MLRDILWRIKPVSEIVRAVRCTLPGDRCRRAFVRVALAACAVHAVLDEERGKIVKAFAMLRPSQTANDEMKKMPPEFATATLAPFIYPRVIDCVDQRPRGRIGRLPRFRLRKH